MFIPGTTNSKHSLFIKHLDICLSGGRVCLNTVHRWVFLLFYGYCLKVRAIPFLGTVELQDICSYLLHATYSVTLGFSHQDIEGRMQLVDTTCDQPLLCLLSVFLLLSFFLLLVAQTILLPLVLIECFSLRVNFHMLTQTETCSTR